MNIIDLYKQEFHSATASMTGAVAAIAVPTVLDILTRIGVGIAVGVGTWAITKTIAWGVAKYKKTKCGCDTCKLG